MDNDLVYLNRRASQERTAALNSQHPGVRHIHLELAQAYEFRVFLLNEPTRIKTDPSQLLTKDRPRHLEMDERPVRSQPASVGPPQQTFII